MKNKIEQFARNHWNDNLSIAWRGGGVRGFWLCHLLLSLDVLYSAKSWSNSSVITKGHLAQTSRTAFKLDGRAQRVISSQRKFVSSLVRKYVVYLKTLRVCQWNVFLINLDSATALRKQSHNNQQKPAINQKLNRHHSDTRQKLTQRPLLR